MGLLFNFKDDQLLPLVHSYMQDKSARRILLRDQILTEASGLSKSLSGLDTLFSYAPQLDQYDFFQGSPWEHMHLLQPPLVRGTLEAGGPTACTEVISNLRILAIALGLYPHPTFSAEKARLYINEVIALNLDALFLSETEEARLHQMEYQQTQVLLEFITLRFPFPGALDYVTKEIEKLSVQRPITTDKIEKLITSGLKLLKHDQELPKSFKGYKDAVLSPTHFSKVLGPQYAEGLNHLAAADLTLEAEQFSESMSKTGLVSRYHACLLEHLRNVDPALIGSALGLGAAGKKNLEQHQKLIEDLISAGINKDTKQAVYGLSKLLERDIFSEEFVRAVQNILSSEVDCSTSQRIQSAFNCSEQEVKSWLTAGFIGILGQPLGVGQGFNPTCQSTRALSYWSQKNPVFFLTLYHEAITQGNVSLLFEGEIINSSNLKLSELNYTIPMDAASVVLLPHLDAIYAEMLKRTGFRGEDAHKWINPGFYGSEVLPGFTDIYHCKEFLLLFKKYYHPSFSQMISQALPQPAGVIIYDRNDKPLGAHAILIQRVCRDPHGMIRVYFYNPNNDSSQIWGKNMAVSVSGNGELEGEASLPFEQFAKCLYAFHF
ncbi:hypothetical protein [Peribacillus deserti]|uniref:Uncharacterized protein n=1 Tax=Peribacillus deserti TaxID=673318 RepID=A0A2N5M448_9BACI|nr:hypothetical protein [Peribacillus deserti]PLT29112.1 hypothetical protein CUU66_14955 [Peribacillus deserti]